jgi:hypothetical protein
MFLSLQFAAGSSAALDCAGLPTEPLLSRFAARAGFVTLRQIFVRRCQGSVMDKLLFWLGIGAAQKGAGSKPSANRHPVLSFVVGTLLALLIAVGLFLLLVSQQ